MEERHDQRRSSVDTAPDFAARTPVMQGADFTRKSNKIQQVPQVNQVDQTVQQVSEEVPNLLAPENFTTTSHNLTNLNEMNDLSNHEIENRNSVR